MESPDTIKFFERLGLVLLVIGGGLTVLAVLMAHTLRQPGGTPVALLLYGLLCDIIGGFFFAYAKSDRHR